MSRGGGEVGRDLCAAGGQTHFRSDPNRGGVDALVAGADTGQAKLKHSSSTVCVCVVWV